MKGIVLGGTRSGVGKTVAALAVMQALDGDGYQVQAAKAGPDFIDPSHHEQVTGHPSRTLDVWMQSPEGVRQNYHRGDGEFCVVEGVMGLYDGDASSTALVAETLDLPVVLVVDAKAGMESVAATALGFQEYAGTAGRDIDVAGVLVQRAHGGRHEAGIRDALPDELTYFGRIPPRENLSIPDRHLGLQLGEEAPLDDDVLASAAQHIDTQRLHSVAREPPVPETRDAPGGESTEKRIAVASDRAFCFAYPATLERLRERAQVLTFAPTAGDTLPPCDGVYLPGGYPELAASDLADSPTLDQLADRAADGLPVFGECGGLMALSRTLTTTDGGSYEMAGILPADVAMCDRYQALDHVELQAQTDGPTANTGQTVRGHEFHYSSADIDRDARFVFDVVRGDGIDGDHDGLTEYRTVGTYSHVHPASGVFDEFVASL